MDIVFDDDNARVLRSVHNELVSTVEDDVVAVARIECHQSVTTTKCVWPSGEMISKFELRVVGEGVEIVVAVDQAGQTLLDDVEERVERRECRVLGIGHDVVGSKNSCGFVCVVFQEPPEPFTTLNRTCIFWVLAHCRKEQYVALALTMP